MNQHTISHSINCIGKGLHSGKDVNLIINPAPEDFGIRFERIDLKENNIIEAKFDNVSQTSYCTTISNEFGAKVKTIEHLMAALWGCGVDNCLIKVDSEEIPIMDGSSEHFVFMIESSGVVEQQSQRKVIRINKPIRVGDEKAYIEIIPGNSFEIDLQIKFENQIIGTQEYKISTSHSFKHDLSRARTFCFEYEIEYLKNNNLALGGSLDNAIVIGAEKILNNSGLRFEDEFVRHKILDCAGDMFLGGRFLAHIKGFCSGHKLNNMLLRAIFSDQDAWSYVN